MKFLNNCALSFWFDILISSSLCRSSSCLRGILSSSSCLVASNLSLTLLYLIASNTLYTSQAKELFLGEQLTDDWVTLTTKLAEKSINLYNTDISLAILGEAGPIPSSNYKIGEIFISISFEGKTTELTHHLRGSRQDIIERSVNNAIWDLLNII